RRVFTVPGRGALRKIATAGVTGPAARGGTSGPAGPARCRRGTATAAPGFGTCRAPAPRGASAGRRRGSAPAAARRAPAKRGAALDPAEPWLAAVDGQRPRRGLDAGPNEHRFGRAHGGGNQPGVG